MNKSQYTYKTIRLTSCWIFSGQQVQFSAGVHAWFVSGPWFNLQDQKENKMKGRILWAAIWRRDGEMKPISCGEVWVCLSSGSVVLVMKSETRFHLLCFLPSFRRRVFTGSWHLKEQGAIVSRASVLHCGKSLNSVKERETKLWKSWLEFVGRG